MKKLNFIFQWQIQEMAAGVSHASDSAGPVKGKKKDED